MKLNRIAAALAAFTLAVSGTLADIYTWNSSGTAWNTTDAAWLDGSGSNVAWVDGNSAVFGSGSMNKWPCPSGTRTANDVTITAAGYTFGWGLLEVTGKFTANADCTLGERFGFAGGSVRIGGPSGKTIWCGSKATNSTHRLTYLEDEVRLNAADDRFFGSVPAIPSDNIVIMSGSPLLTAASNMALDANRSIRIAGGALLRLSATTGNTLVIKGVISGEPDASHGFVTTNCISLPYYTGNPYASAVTSGTIVFDPGERRTNDVGRLHVKSSLRLNSGTTRVGNAKDGGTGSEAPLYVQGNGSAFSDTCGNLVVDGATLLNSQTGNYRYIHVGDFGQITVRNGGRIDMPGVHWLNVNGQLTVGDGEFVANILRVSQSASSKINLDDGGLIAVNRLGIDPAATHACQFRFNGGRIQSRGGSDSFLGTVTTTATTDSDWESVVFSVGEKGAGFDSTNGQNIVWTRPLVQADGVANDGGVFVTGCRTDRGLIFTKANTYNGPTVVLNAMLQVRADNALPSGTTLRLVGGVIWADTFETESPARRTVQSLGRLEGSGTIYNSWNVTVNGAIAPDTDGTLYLAERCSLSGDFEIRGDAGGCGCLKVAANQSIAGLTLKAADMAAMDTDAARNTYKILDAPNGYTGQFALASDFPSDKWKVRYTGTAAYIDSVAATMIIMR